jgi:peptidoglycan/xylan/chitin deacetylase (PgdA/CDA1 family)
MIVDPELSPIPRCASTDSTILSRREFIGRSTLVGSGLLLGKKGFAALSENSSRSGERQAQIAITLDLEMSRNFPQWDDTHWDYEKGLLNDEAKRYSVEAARRVKAHGGVIHFFCVGRVLEQENVDWLKEIVAAGHPVGNHTYDHVNVLATKPDDIQFRFKRSPWLIAGRTPATVIRDNIQLTTDALKNRIGIAPAGFRTPGGFAPGLGGREDVQRMLLDLGFKWISCKVPPVPLGEPGREPSREVFDRIVKAQADAQPFVYPTGLIDVPMSPISDVGAFRNGRWKLDSFLEAVRVGVEWAIEHRGVFDLLCHPSVMYPSDPEFKTIELVCDLVKKAGERAAIVDLGTIAGRMSATTR